MKRNEKKNQQRIDIEETDPIVGEVDRFAERAGILIMTLGSDYDLPRDKRDVVIPDTVEANYEQRVNYLLVLLAEIRTLRIEIVLKGDRAEATSPPETEAADESPAPETEQPEAAEGEGNDGDAEETE